MKTIIVIGGGISGLATLRRLVNSYRDDRSVQVRLLEAGAYPGGAVRTVREDGYCFETGPAGFLDNSPPTFELIEALGLQGRLVRASPLAKKRFIARGRRLYEFPLSPGSFATFPLLTPWQKLRVFAELFIPAGGPPRESVFAFASRRFGRGVAEIFFDPFVTGIFAGDVQRLEAASAFPTMIEMERESGSLIRGVLSRLKKHKSVLWSFSDGMSELMDGLAKGMSERILLNAPVQTVAREGTRYRVFAGRLEYSADEVWVCAPAYEASRMLMPVSSELGRMLNEVIYAGMAVIGLGYRREDLKNLPQGLGYLRLSRDGGEVLGTLVESNIFPGHAPQGTVFFRVMLGGRRNPSTVNRSASELYSLAQDEIERVYGVKAGPVKSFLSVWPRAIPQYELGYGQWKARVANLLGHIPGLHLRANYLGGISLNDCISNSKNP